MLDIILEDNKILLIFHKDFFGEGFMENPKVQRIVDEVYSNYGTFSKGEMCLGFSNCLTFISKKEDTVIYEWPFPEQIRHDCSCLGTESENNCPYCKNEKVICNVEPHLLEIFMATIYIFLFYEIEMKISDPKKNPHQSFSLEIAVGIKGKATTRGWVYPGLLSFLKKLKAEEQKEIKTFIKKEMERLHYYIHGTKTNFMRADIDNDGFLIHVPSFDNGCYISCYPGNMEYKGKRYIVDHNVFGSMDQFLLIIGLIALNTYFRKQVKDD